MNCSIVLCERKSYSLGLCKPHYMKQWRTKNWVKSNEYLHKYNLELRIKLMQILDGVKCNRCGFSDERALQLDHIKGDGYTYKKGVAGNSRIIKYYIANPIEANTVLQVLCANCNSIKRNENKEYAGYFPRPKKEQTVGDNV